MTEYWGKSDTSVHFCEKPYKKSKYIAEFYNTISAVSYLLVGIFFSFTKIKKIGYTLSVLSIGTALLHGTQRYYGQILDELSMLFLSFYIIEELRKIEKQKTNKLILGALVGIYLGSYNYFSMFFLTFVFCQLYIVFLVKKLIKKQINTNKVKKLLINSYIIIFLISTTCWVLDQCFCYKVENMHLHAWWHIGTAMSIFLGLLFLVI